MKVAATLAGAGLCWYAWHTHNVYPMVAAALCATLLLAVLAWQGTMSFALRRALQGFHSNAVTAALIVNHDGQALVHNQRALDLLGYDNAVSLPDLLGAEVWSLILDNTAELAAGRLVQVEFERLCEGHHRTLAASARTFSFPGAKPQLLLLELRDLSTEVSLQNGLRNGAEQIQSLLAHSSDLAITFNSKLQIEFANPTAAQILGSTAGQLVGRPLYELIDAAHRRKFMHAMETINVSHRNDLNLGLLTLQATTELQLDCRLLKVIDTQGHTHYGLIAPTDVKPRSTSAVDQPGSRFSEVFHHSPDAILIVREADALILDFNSGFTRLLGYSREAAIGEAGLVTEFWHNPAEHDEVMASLATQREVTGCETTLKRSDGSLVHVELSLRYIDIDGDLCILFISRDITSRISAEAVLVETEEKFVKVFSESPDGIVVIRHVDGIITDVNEAFVLRSGYHRDELLGENFIQFMGDARPEQINALLTEVASEGVLATQEFAFFTKQGDAVPALISASTLELGGEEHLLFIAKDISKQRATEESLRRSEERFRGIFENAPIGIMLVDLQGQIFQTNHTATSLLAYDEEHMNGVHIARLVPGEDRPALKEALAQLADDKIKTHKSERRMACRNGIELWANMNIVLQYSSAGEPLYYIVQLADISDIKLGQQRMERMAFYDTLTNLANRRLFQDRLTQTLQRCARNAQSAALMYLDLDNFKRVNDTLGHQTGDRLLKEVAHRLQECVRTEDTVGRSGGDEFTILLNHISTPNDAGLVAEKILEYLRQPIEIGGHPLIVTTSIGITVFPGDGRDPNVLMSNADLAMYKAKERGRNNYQFYSDDLNANAAKRLRTEYEIRQALENEEFELYYQPKIDLATQKIVGVESLIRWNHPRRGLLTPDEFIEIAEDTGSIIDIGSWVIEEASRACRRLSERHGRPIDVAINISPRQFRDPNLLATMQRSIREQALNPENIEIEITETMLMQDVAAAHATVLKLSELGVKLAIDDFGTGYSSLNYLRRFPIDTVKIDRSFIMDLPGNTDDLAITRAVIAMAHQLKMRVVAEGVETAEQMQFLADEDCEYAQGYLFSKALRMADVEVLLDDDAATVIDWPWQAEKTKVLAAQTR